MGNEPRESPFSGFAVAPDDGSASARMRRVTSRFLGHWILLAAALLVIGGVLAHFSVSERRASESTASARLAFRASSLAETLESHLKSTAAVLDEIRLQLFESGAGRRVVPDISGYLKTLVHVSDCVLRFDIMDEAGVVVESSDASRIGQKGDLRKDFLAISKNPEPDRTLVSVSPKSAAGDENIVLGRAVVDLRGRFAGVVSATLDLDYFREIFELARQNPDVSVSLLPESGKSLIHASPLHGSFESDVFAHFRRGLTQNPGAVVFSKRGDG